MVITETTDYSQDHKLAKLLAINGCHSRKHMDSWPRESLCLVFDQNLLKMKWAKDVSYSFPLNVFVNIELVFSPYHVGGVGSHVLPDQGGDQGDSPFCTGVIWKFSASRRESLVSISRCSRFVTWKRYSETVRYCVENVMHCI